jgi:hypothetical protein
MRVRLVWIDRNFRREDISRREEILDGESVKNPNRAHISKLIARHYPNLTMAGGLVWLIDSDQPGFRWHVKSWQKDKNVWTEVYAEPLDESPQLSSSEVS